MIGRIGTPRRDALRYRRILANARAFQRHLRLRQCRIMRVEPPSYYAMRFSTDNARLNFTKLAAAVMRPA